MRGQTSSSLMDSTGARLLLLPQLLSLVEATFISKMKSDTTGMSRQDTPSNFSSVTLQHTLNDNAQRSTEAQGLLMQNMVDLNAQQPWTANSFN